MPLPQLIEEDLRVLDAALTTLVNRSEASMAMLIEQAGFLITQAGDCDQFDTTTMAALSAGSFAATQSMATLTRETNFNSLYQQGDNYSLLILSVDDSCLLVVVFKAIISVGAVKYYGQSIVAQVGEQLRKARERAPDQTLDLATLNLEDSLAFFHRKSAEVN
jgi:predicted regulator of Ras-like GTPase activity (Roadblock/LC7/MglB family)